MKKSNIEWSEIVVYLTTLLGVVTSEYLVALRKGGSFEFQFEIPKLIMGAIVAFSIILHDESGFKTFKKVGNETEEQRESRILGKRLNMRRRLSAAIQSGLLWPQMSGLL